MNNIVLYITRFFIVAISYFIAIWIGKKTAVPFGQATDIWPAAGVALAFCVAYGNKYWPAIIIGGIAAYLQLGFKIDTANAMIISSAALQAVFGAWAFKTSFNKSLPTDQITYTLVGTTDIIKLLLWGGAIACLINATIATLALYYKGDISSTTTLAVHWYTWWGRDLLGIILFAPVLILILSDNEHNITNLIKAGTEMKKYQERVTLAKNGGRVDFWEYDIKQKSTTVSKNHRDIIGYKLEGSSIKDEKFMRMVHKDDRAETERKFEEYVEGKTPIFESEMRIRDKAGHWIWILARGKAFKWENGKPRYFIGMTTDISKIKEVELELRDLNTELEEFTYRTSHDLRAPVVSAIGLLGLIRDSIKQGNTEQALNCIEYVYASLKQVDVLVGDIMNLTTIKRKKEEKSAINFKKLLDEIIKKFKYMDNFKSIEIQKDFRFKGPVISLESRIRIILENMLSNAIKYYDPRKKKPFIKISTYQENQDFVLRIEDNGLGIPEEYRGKLFQMFKRFHPKVSFGSGLGLYLAKKSADILKGEIFYEDTGDGSAFTFRMPLKNNEE